MYLFNLKVREQIWLIFKSLREYGLWDPFWDFEAPVVRPVNLPEEFVPLDFLFLKSELWVGVEELAY
jgi:hypothetical protein